MESTSSKPERYDGSYQSYRIDWLMRWRLLWSARSDRRAGLPIGLSADTTPVLRDLVKRRDDACEHERTRYFATVETLSVRLAELEENLPALERQLADRTAALDRVAAMLDESYLTSRRAGEQGLPAELVRQRRRAEHERKEAEARAVVEDLVERLDRGRAEQAKLRATLQSRADVARSRVLRIAEHADRMAAVYRRALVRRHPQREALVDRWTTELAPPPAWVLTDELVPSHRPSGVDA